MESACPSAADLFQVIDSGDLTGYDFKGVIIPEEYLEL